jgi:lipopolysaccharide transport system permease protein
LINYNVFKYFLNHELKDRFLGNITGVLWVFVQPIIMLFVYWFVFENVFKSRVPEALEVGFVVYLAVGFWPWLAFSESIGQSISSVVKNSDLIGKNKIDLKLPVLATVTAYFVMNLIGYLIVLISLSVIYDHFTFSSLLLLIFPILQLYFLALALSLILSSIQIFIRDTLQIMTTIITVWFFLTPIIYSETIIPERFQTLIKLNPIFTPISFIHKAVITGDELPWANMIILSIFIMILLVLSIKIFDKLSVHFEEFL